MMRENLDVDIDLRHLSRVEGHGNIRVRVRGGVVEEARWEVVETPRFFEVMLKGKHYTSAGILTARICGICSIGHCLASVRATEAAFGIEIPPLAAKLRLLAKHGETLQSHILHLLYLAAPDFLGLPSAVPLLHLDPDVFSVAGRLKRAGNAICDTIAGRTTHPVSIQVGGMARVPDTRELAALKDHLEAAADDLRAVVDLVRNFDIPAFVRETEHVGLAGIDEYPWIGGRLISSDGVDRDESDYLAMTNEYVTVDNTSKWCKLSRDSFAVGALSRFNLNAGRLHPEAQRIAATLGLVAPCHNPFMNNVAQLVECVHVINDGLVKIDELVAVAPAPHAHQQPPLAVVEPRAGRGVGAVEVPRGILFHDYEYDSAGRIVRANCVIPTTQNNANIHHDLFALVEQQAALGRSDAEIERLCAMLVRAYDPCISCSVH